METVITKKVSIVLAPDYGNEGQNTNKGRGAV
jgi:hypothetical protein